MTTPTSLKLSDFRAAGREIRQFWRPPRKLKLSEWADEEFVLSAENSAEAGRWKTLPYQREILDCLTDPKVMQVVFMKSARVGATKMMCVGSAYYVAQEPTTIMFVQPTIEGADEFSKEEIEVMWRDVPALQTVQMRSAKEKISHKMFRGGSLSLVGANSGNGFRRVSRRIIFLDEVDSYPPSAGDDGDPVRLAIRRSEMFWNRKIFAASTPLVAGVSRIEKMFEEGDQRYYELPCPHCGHFDRLVFTKRPDGIGHYLLWEGTPDTAHMVCSLNGCVIDASSKFDMIRAGKWVAREEFKGIASFHISALYSYSPNSSWANIVSEFLQAKKEGPDSLRVFMNTVLGETWKESGDAPDWERLYGRRETYAIGTVPAGVKFLTAGLDVQNNRVVYEVVGWGADKQSWSIDSGVIMMDTSNLAEWAKVDELLDRTYPREGTDEEMAVRTMAVDSGFNTQTVYQYSQTKPTGRVLAVKGLDGRDRSLLGHASKVEVKMNGKAYRNGQNMWPVGVDVAKDELYGFLRLTVSEDGTYPFGYCHFPQYDQEFFKQITAEHVISKRNTKGFTVRAWEVIPGRQNHGLDARNYARAAASYHGLDKQRQEARKVLQQAGVALAEAEGRPPPAPIPVAAPAQPVVVKKPDSRFFGQRPRGNWLRR